MYEERGAYAEEAGDIAVATAPPVAAIDVDAVTTGVLEQIRSDPEFAALVAEQLRGRAGFFAVESRELISGDETHQVEFKSTARWNLREQGKDKRMEDAVVKTVAGFLNTEGGTLLIGVDDARKPIGLSHDLLLVKPPNPDGLVNWLTTHLTNALTHTAVLRTRARIDAVEGVDICRVDIARSSVPVTARMSDKAEVFWVRMNNSTRALPEVEVEDYVREHWG